MKKKIGLLAHLTVGARGSGSHRNRAIGGVSMAPPA